MKLSKPTLSAIAILLFLFLTIDSTSAQRTYTKIGGQIPPDFSEINDTLIVIKRTQFNLSIYSSTLKKHFEKSYTGNYKIITENELTDYPPEKYRYLFELENYFGAQIAIYEPLLRGYRVTGKETIGCMVTDRATGKQYRTDQRELYGKLLNAYLPALSKEIRK